MAQAYEYKVVESNLASTLQSSLATEDAAGWEVIGYSSTYTGGTNPINWSALLRRRV